MFWTFTYPESTIYTASSVNKPPSIGFVYIAQFFNATGTLLFASEKRFL